MTHPPTSYPHQPSMDNRLVRIEFSTATWLTIAAVLDGRQPPPPYNRNTHWARDHIIRKLQEAHGYAECDERPT